MKPSTLPTWLLDFDGCINVERKGAWPRIWNTTASSGHYFRWAPELVVQIHRIHRSGLVDIRWASTWCSRAEVIEKALGLPSFGRAFDTCPVGGLQKKQEAVNRVLNSGRPLIWTDDEMIPKWGPFHHKLIVSNSLIISPSGVIGLQPDDIQAIKDYIGYVES